MVSKEQIACPAHDEEDRDEELEDTPDEEAGELAIEGRDADGGLEEELEDAFEDEIEAEGARDAFDEDLPEGPGGDESACAEGVPPDRCFDISPEEFCGDPYEQEGHIESRQELGRKGEEAAVRYLSSPAGTRLSSAIGFAASARRTSSPATRKARCASSK